MDLEEHKRLFEEIVRRYDLQDPQKAEEIAKFLTRKQKVGVEEFATLFAMDVRDARIFLSFIETGIRFREHAKF